MEVLIRYQAELVAMLTWRPQQRSSGDERKNQKVFRINAVDDDATGDGWIEANFEWKGVHRCTRTCLCSICRRCIGCRSEERQGPGQMSAQRVAWWASGQVSMRGDFCRIDGVTARDSGEKNRRRRRGIHSNSDQTKGVSEWWRRGQSLFSSCEWRG